MDQNIIYVYVKGNNNSISGDDIVQWLGFLDQIEDFKLQLDVKENDVCYYVRFRHAGSAQLAVSSLDGEKLKNCVIKIKSPVHQPKEEPVKELRGSDPSSLLSRNSSLPLPLNEIMPKELKMSDSLLKYVKCVEDDLLFSDGRTIFEAVNALQQEWWKVRKEVENQQLQLEKINDSIQEKNGSQSAVSAAPLTALVTKFPVSLSVTTPHLLLTAISHSVGPIEEYYVVQLGVNFVLSVRLMMMEDVEEFFALCSESRKATSNSKSQLIRSVEWCTSDDTSWITKPHNVDLQLVEQFC